MHRQNKKNIDVSKNSERIGQMSKKTVYSFIILTATILLLAGQCNAPPTKPPPKPETSFSLELSQTNIEIRLGNSKTITVTIKPINGFKEDVKLSLVGGTDKIKGVFSPNPSTGSSTLNITIDKTTTVKTYNLFVKGKSTTSDKSDTQALSLKVLPLPGITVTGIVLDNIRRPITNAVVSIAGKVASTDGNGKFRFEQVKTPYDLIVVLNNPKQAHIYQGLNRPDPYIYLTNQFQKTGNSTNVSGTLSGGDGFPNKNETITVVAYASDNGRGAYTVNPFAGPNYGALKAEWYGNIVNSGKLHALQWKRDTSTNHKPLKYLGYGTTEATLKKGVNANYNIELKPLATATISGNLKLPSGFKLVGKVLFLQLGKLTAIPVVIETTNDPTFSYAVPNNNIPIGVQITATKGAQTIHSYRSNLKPTDIVNFDLTSPPTLLKPVNNFKAVGPGTEYSWTAFSNGIHVLGIFSQSNSTPSFILYTSKTKAILPYNELSKLGMNIPLSTDYSWLVSGLAPYKDIDSFASKSGGLGVFGLGQDINWGISEVFKFKTGD